jgi:tetratricopeptide (TPR) repeat protein
MTFSEIQQIHSAIPAAIQSNSLRDALGLAGSMLNGISDSEINQRYNSIYSTYQTMLKYSFEMAPDPQRQKIYTDLQHAIIELADTIKDQWVVNLNLFNRRAELTDSSHTEVTLYNRPDEIVSALSPEYVKDELLDSAGILNGKKAEQEQLVRSLFYFFWLKNEYSGDEKAHFRLILGSSEINPEIKELMISALSLSLMRHFDREKFHLLFEYGESEHAGIRQRALIGFFINLLVYAGRLILYPDLMGRIEAIPDNPKMQGRLLAILIQFIRASETDMVTKKIRDEIVPEVMKIRSELEDKLKLEDLLSKNTFDEKNPEWENFFKDSPDVYQKLEQFSKMQIEGADVFMGAFAMLKNFAFFQQVPNWFQPFKGDSLVVSNAFSSLTESMNIPEFVAGLEDSSVMCNSDKYSFCLNISNMPAQQRKMMLELFNMEMKAMNEVVQDEVKLDVESGNKIINTQYLQDLYRFFKLQPVRKEYPDIFGLPTEITKNKILGIIFGSPKSMKNLAEFYFARDYYAEALPLFVAINEKDNSFELFEKIAFCYQKMGKYEKAISLYSQAELFDQNKLWLQKKLGYCYRKTGNVEKAIAFYQQIIKAEPKDLNNLAYLGQLYIDIEDFDEALKYYYKVEYAQPDNVKVCRPIGWCSFVLGKYDIAIRYFSKIIESKPGKSDYLNIGHSYWAAGDLTHALEAYRQAIINSGKDERWFRETFLRDSKYLKKTGIDDLDVMLMIDYVLML